jgi:hypothetical protein
MSVTEAVDAMGAVCLELLKVTDAPMQAPKNDAAWLPPIRTEVRSKSTGRLISPRLKEETPGPSHSVDPTAQAKVAKEAKPSAEPETPPVADQERIDTPAKPSEATTSTVEEADGDRKKLIIYNRGSPLELEFGYERK